MVPRPAPGDQLALRRFAAAEQPVRHAVLSPAIDPILTSGVDAKLEHRIAHGRMISEVPEFGRAKPREDACLSDRIAKGLEPDGARNGSAHARRSRSTSPLTIRTYAAVSHAATPT